MFHSSIAFGVASIIATAAFAGDPFISMSHLATTPRAGYDVGAAEIVAFDPGSRRAFVVNGLTAAIDIFDLTAPNAPVAAGSISVLPYGGGVQSLAVKNGLLVAGISAVTITDPGKAVFFRADGSFVASVQVGALPDMVCFTPDARHVITANEGEPNATYTVDPEGTISVIDVSGKTITQANVTTIGFNGLPAGVIDPSIVPFGFGSPNIGQDLEPEYVAVSADSLTAWITLQEHSAVAVVDLVTKSIISVRPLGYKDHGRGTPSITTATLQNPPVLGTTAAGQDILLGGFSGLWIDSVDATTGVINLWANTDRGPNLEPLNVDADAALERPFALPDFQPRICTFTYNPTTNALALTGQILLRKPDGTPMTGLPNIHALGAGLAYSDEQPCDLFGNALALDPLGGDLEGLVRTADGNIWMCDEYRPALYKFDATGLMLSRFVPVGSNSYGVDLGTEAFPAVYAQRRDNRGFEAIAAWNSDIYCFVQSPLDNPDVANDANSKASRLVRIAKFNALTNAVVAEYVYLLEGATSDKLGDACAFAPGKFLVIERDSTTGSSSLKKIFEVDLAGATDISTLAPSVVGPGGTLERMTPAQLAAAGIVPVSKSVFVDIAATGYANSIDKVEGIAMRDPSTVFIINDNDFRMPLTFNIATGTFRANPTAIETTLGMITFSGNGLDPSDQNGSNSISAWPVQGAYMPDAITSFSTAGANYYITANEGDQRVWGPFDDQTTVSAVTLDPQVFPGRTWLRNNARLGRLQIRKSLGDLDGDGDYDRIVSYGGRSFTIWNAAGQRVWDSGDFIEQHTATVYPNNFNARHTNNTRDNRSRSKGPEPEGVTTGVIGGKRYMFGLLERIGGIMAWSIDSPGAPVFQGYINMRNFAAANNTPAAGDLGPEGIQFVSAADSPNGSPLILLANEISGTLSIFQVDVVCNTPGDLNGDCSVNGNDLALLLGNWGGSGTGDINSDGVVGAEDLSIMLNNWI